MEYLIKRIEMNPKNDAIATDALGKIHKDVTIATKITTSTTDVPNMTYAMATSYKLPLVDPDMPAMLYSHKTAIIVMMCIFITITLTVTVAIIVFCRKKNSVFALQKCEQDIETVYEMDDMNTEIELSDDETLPDEELTLNVRSRTYPSMSRLCQYNLDSPNLYAPTTTTSALYSGKVPRSKTCSVLQPKRSKCKRDVIFAPSKRHKGHISNIKRPCSLPLSSSFSGVNLSANYQSMVIAADVEPQKQSESEKRLINNSTQEAVSQANTVYDVHRYNDVSGLCAHSDVLIDHSEEVDDVHICTPLLQSVLNAGENNSISKPTSPKLTGMNKLPVNENVQSQTQPDAQSYICDTGAETNPFKRDYDKVQTLKNPHGVTNQDESVELNVKSKSFLPNFTSPFCGMSAAKREYAMQYQNASAGSTALSPEHAQVNESIHQLLAHGTQTTRDNDTLAASEYSESISKQAQPRNVSGILQFHWDDT